MKVKFFVFYLILSLIIDYTVLAQNNFLGGYHFYNGKISISANVYEGEMTISYDDLDFLGKSIFNVSKKMILSDTMNFEIKDSNYSLSFFERDTLQFLLLNKGKDSLLIYQVLKRDSLTRVVWEMRNIRSFLINNGFPASYKLFYFNINDPVLYPLCPDLMVTFKRFEKSGEEYLFYRLKDSQGNNKIVSNCLWVKQSRKWKKGKLTNNTKTYAFGTKYGN